MKDNSDIGKVLYLAFINVDILVVLFVLLIFKVLDWEKLGKGCIGFPCNMF